MPPRSLLTAAIIAVVCLVIAFGAVAILQNSFGAALSACAFLLLEVMLIGRRREIGRGKS